MELFKNIQKFGEFYIDNSSLPGDLKLNGSETTLELHSKFDLSGSLDRHGDIHGSLKGNEKVSLLDCITNGTSKSYNADPQEESFSAVIFPHYVVLGASHITRAEKKITAINFVIQDATIAFYDFGAFGSILDKEMDIKTTLESISEKRKNEFEVGDYPELFYYSGKRIIFKIESELGDISVYHAPSISFPSPDGIQVKNKIPVRIEFKEPLDFQGALEKHYILLPFLEIILGRPQNIKELNIEIKGDEYPQYLSVYSTMQPEYKNRSRDPHPGDILINGGIQPTEFSAALSAWIKRHDDWRDSRTRFIQSFNQQSQYTIDRLVATANMFDILPDAVTGVPDKLSDELISALDKAKEIFKNIKPCSESQRALSDLGRIGKHNLKKKIKNRVKIVTDELEGFFPDIENIIDEAVNCRNFFVHGTNQGKLSRENRYYFLSYFTDMFEFIFAASDLIECGWKIREWATKGSTLSHPFGIFLHSYKDFKKEFDAAIKNQG